MGKISKVLEIDNCNDEMLFQAIYKSDFWEKIAPTKNITANFIAPNVLYSKIHDQIEVLKFPIEMEGEIVLMDKGKVVEKGRIIEFNVRNNKDIKELEGRIRIKFLSPNKSKVGVFVENFALADSFFKVIGATAEFILQSKITEIMRNLEKFCKSHKLAQFLQ